MNRRSLFAGLAAAPLFAVAAKGDSPAVNVALHSQRFSRDQVSELIDAIGETSVTITLSGGSFSRAQVRELVEAIAAARTNPAVRFAG